MRYLSASREIGRPPSSRLRRRRLPSSTLVAAARLDRDLPWIGAGDVDVADGGSLLVLLQRHVGWLKTAAGEGEDASSGRRLRIRGHDTFAVGGPHLHG